MAFEDALAIERYVNEELLTIHKAADDSKDVHVGIMSYHPTLLSIHVKLHLWQIKCCGQPLYPFI